MHFEKLWLITIQVDIINFKDSLENKNRLNND